MVLALVAGLSACGPSLPSDPDSYVVSSVGDLHASQDGPAVSAYQRVFGGSAVVYRVGGEDPASGLPPAVVAVVPLDEGTTEADVAARAVGPGDVVVEREVEGVKVRSVTSRQGGIVLHVRLWRPSDDVMVVVIGTRSAEDADAVVAAVARQVGAARGSDG